MKLYTIHAGMFKLDGGAMFGVVPKSIWNKLNPSDEFNMCSWAMRCLLIEDGKRLLLIDNGMGNKQSEKFFGYYYLHGDFTLEKSLNEHGFTAGDITDVFLTHLHFDHCGGSIAWNKDRTAYDTAFKNATYWSHSRHWQWAIEPNDREKASFLKENILPMQESGQLKFADVVNELPAWFTFKTVSGHTESMMLPLITFRNKKWLYMADLIPSVAHLPMPYIMAYDTKPLLTLQEKRALLNEAVDQQYFLFFEHDPSTECVSLARNEKGIVASGRYPLNDLL